MALKTKFLSFKRERAAAALRKNIALIQLYKDYIDFLKNDVVRKIDNKVLLRKEKEYRLYQNVYYDVGEEKEIFDVVFNHKYAKLKQQQRLKFRVYREKTRRKIAKLDPETQFAEIDALKQSIDQFETTTNEYIESVAKEWREEFEIESAKLVASNPTEAELEVLKQEVGNRIASYRDEIQNKLVSKNENHIARIREKIARLESKTESKREKLLNTTNLLSAAEAEENIKIKERKVSKLKEEIAKHQALLENGNEEEKVKQQKILNSLTNDLSLAEGSNKNKEDIIKDDEVLAIDNLCMYFGGIKAVNKLSFFVKEKEIFGLIGPNGAGKTTVFNCITQFYKPTAGNISFRNKNGEIVDLTKEVVHNVILQGIVRTFQNLEVIKDITVLDNLLIAAHRDYTSNLFQHMLHTPILKVEENVIKQRAIKVLEFMGLLKYKDMYAWGLPYGILKKIEIARTLMCNPQLIILDEPAAGLNDSETVELAQLIRRIRDEYNTTILLVEHDMGLVMDVCDRICAISFGNLLALGTPKEIQNNKAVQEAYLGVSEE